MSDLAPAGENPNARRMRKEITEEAARGIGVQFPGWDVWYSSWSSAWNACRKGVEPWFGRPASGWRFMVAAYGPGSLVALLEAQVRLDIEAEFPAWKVGQTGTGCWYAVSHDQTGSGDDALVRVMCRPTISGLHATLRDLGHDARA